MFLLQIFSYYFLLLNIHPCRLPFGASPAVWLVEKLVRPLKLFLHTLSVDQTVYIDDGILIQGNIIKMQKKKKKKKIGNFY